MLGKVKLVPLRSAVPIAADALASASKAFPGEMP